MAAWWESPKDEWRFEWLRLLVARARAAARPERPHRRDLDLGDGQRDAERDS
jgi:hypothetical protein